MGGSKACSNGTRDCTNEQLFIECKTYKICEGWASQEDDGNILANTIARV
jgi:hypothetical protein